VVAIIFFAATLFGNQLSELNPYVPGGIFFGQFLPPSYSPFLTSELIMLT